MAMLLTREEMSFDFGGAKLDPVTDKQILEWMIAQFLYGEMTGIQIGHWLFEAPDIDAAKFLARQAVEEMQHVDNFLRMLKMMEMEAQPGHPVVRFLATGMMGGSWAEHVAIEMAAGEGFVLLAFYAMIDTLDHQPSVDILNRAVKQEERHVEFGETQTMRATEDSPGLRRRLLGLNLVSIWAVGKLAKWMGKRLPQDHPVMKFLPEFLAHTNRCAELRLQRMGLLKGTIAELGWLRRKLLVAEAYGAKVPSAIGALLRLPFRMIMAPFRRKQRLTDTYLEDPYIRDFELPGQNRRLKATKDSAA